jgi:hypothetical protein
MDAVAACPLAAARAAASPLCARVAVAPPLRVAPRASRHALVALAPRAVALGASYGDRNASGAEVRARVSAAARPRRARQERRARHDSALARRGRSSSLDATPRATRAAPPIARLRAAPSHAWRAAARRCRACGPSAPANHPGARPRPRANLTLFRGLRACLFFRFLSFPPRASSGARPQNLKRLLLIGEMQVLDKLRREHKWNDEAEVVREEAAHAASMAASAAAARDAEENAFRAMDAADARSGR